MRIFATPNYNFIKWRWHALILSLALIWGGVASMWLRGGLPLGIDFSGGTSVVLQFTQPTSEDVIRKALDPVSTDKVVQKFGTANQNQIMVRLPMMKGQEEGTNLEAGVTQVTEALQKANVGQFTVVSKDLVGPTVGADLGRKASTRRSSRSPASSSTSRSASAYLRGGRDRRDVPRHPHHARVPQLVRLRPVAQRHRGDPHDHRLLGERHDRRLRPRA
jgi:hypothetical protein